MLMLDGRVHAIGIPHQDLQILVGHLVEPQLDVGIEVLDAHGAGNENALIHFLMAVRERGKIDVTHL